MLSATFAVTFFVPEQPHSPVTKWLVHGVAPSIDGGVSSGGSAFYTSFAGQTVERDDILIKFTWLGDFDLDGIVSAGDYSPIDGAFSRQYTVGNVSGWINGDLNRNGHLDAADYMLINLAFANQTGRL